MKEVTCPNCNATQIVSKNNLCSYCFFNLNINTENTINKINEEKKETNIPLDSDKSNLTDEQILSMINENNIKTPLELNSSNFRIGVIIVIIVSILNFIIDNYIFIYKYSGLYYHFLVITFSIISTYFIYKYIDKKYDISYFNDNFITKISSFVSRISISNSRLNAMYSIFFFNVLIIMLNLNFINDLSSSLSPPKKEEFVITEKYTTTRRIKGTPSGMYYITISDGNTEDTLKVSKYIWNVLDVNDATLVTKRGLFFKVVWSIDQGIYRNHGGNRFKFMHRDY